jgi:hypothetical protein
MSAEFRMRYATGTDLRVPGAAQHYEPNLEKTQSGFLGKRALTIVNSIRLHG